MLLTFKQTLITGIKNQLLHCPYFQFIMLQILHKTQSSHISNWIQTSYFPSHTFNMIMCQLFFVNMNSFTFAYTSKMFIYILKLCACFLQSGLPFFEKNIWPSRLTLHTVHTKQVSCQVNPRASRNVSPASIGKSQPRHPVPNRL